MTSWASPTASSWRSSACTIACSNHRQKRPLFLSPHPETAALPAFQPLCKILRQSPDFSAFSNQRSSCRLSPYGPNADLLDSVPGCGRRVSSIKSDGSRYLLKTAHTIHAFIETDCELSRSFLEKLIYGDSRIASDNQPLLFWAGFTFFTLRFWLLRHHVLLSSRFLSRAKRMPQPGIGP